MMEIWKPVPGYGANYEASSLGRVRSKARVVTKFCGFLGRVINQEYSSKILTGKSSKKDGYIRLHISVDAKKFNVAAHKMVLLAFQGRCPYGMEGCHNNGIPSDNKPSNLRWDTHFNNNQDRKKHGRYAKRENHPMAKLFPNEIEEIRAYPNGGKFIQKKYNISASQIWRIRNNLSWPS